MPLAQSPAPAISLLFVTFVAGFALSALIFWLVQRRAQHQHIGRAASTPSGGKHALRTSARQKPADSGHTASATAVTVLAAQGDTTVSETASSSAESSIDAEATHPDLPIAPQQRTEEPVEIPPMPTDLFERHYEAQFERARKRIERLRAQLNEQ
jgi:hypothetical protein